MYELAHPRTAGDKPTASELGAELGLDAGYLSRILRRFRKEGLLATVASKDDARRTHLWLTQKGRNTFAPLERGTNDEVAALLGQLPSSRQGKVVAAMRSVEALLGDNRGEPSFALRTHRPGDMGWVICPRCAVRAGIRLERGLRGPCCRDRRAVHPQVQPGAGALLDRRDGRRAGWLGVPRAAIEDGGQAAPADPRPRARGQGIGKRLVDECIAHARKLGYRKLTLWTQSTLLAARHIYKAAGFKLVTTEPHCSFGVDLVGEYWELKL